MSTVKNFFRPLTGAVKALLGDEKAAGVRTSLKVKHGDLARVAFERRKQRTALRDAVKVNTRGLPAGVPRYVAEEARRIEAMANTGRLIESGVGDLRITRAEGVLNRIDKTAAARRRQWRPSKKARRVRLRGSCRASVFVADLKARRQAAFA